MSKLVDNHPLARDFPEFKDVIHNLKAGDLHFSKMLAKYEILDKQIVRAEQGVEHMSEAELESLKMDRVRMKDALYQMLKGLKVI